MGRVRVLPAPVVGGGGSGTGTGSGVATAGAGPVVSLALGMLIAPQGTVPLGSDPLRGGLAVAVFRRIEEWWG